MGIIVGLFKLILRIILVLSVLIAFILLIPNLPPYTKFTSIKVEPTLERSGNLAPNDIINQPKQLYKDKLLGPECFQIWNDEVYTSLATGEIVKLSRGRHVTFVTKIGQPCTGLTQEHICGRPLGFVIDDKNNNLIVADSYYGIWKVSLQTNKKQLLVSPHVAIDGKVPMLFNSVALDNKGDIYWTHSSSDFHLKDGMFSIFSDPSGRLLHYNSAKNESKVLLNDLWFANGLAVSPDNQFVVVAETSRYRLNKYYINGPRKGESEIFVAGLPGLPDNVRPLPDGSGILVALYNVFDDDNPMIIKTMSETPLVRKLLCRLLRLLEMPFEFLQTHFSNHVFESVVYFIGHFSAAKYISTGISGLVQIDWNGKIIASYYNTDGRVGGISDAIVFDDQLLTGSPHNQDFVGAVPAPPLLKKAYAKTIKEKSEQVNKPKVNEPKIVPKTAKPVEKSQPAQAKPVEKKQDREPASQAKQQAKRDTIREPEVKPKVIKPEQADIKPKVSKEAEAKMKVDPPKSKEESPKAKVEPPRVKVEQPKVKVEQPKVKVEQPKVKVEQPKVKVEQPKAKVEPPKVKEEPLKPKVQKEKPVEKPKVIQKEQELKPKQVVKESKNEKQTESKIKQDSSKETSKPEKQAEKAQIKPNTASEPKTAPKKTDEPKNKPSEPKSQPKKGGEEQKFIPIEEEIPSDTMKPSKEKLKVIKRDGPQEIPNPNL